MSYSIQQNGHSVSPSAQKSAPPRSTPPNGFHPVNHSPEWSPSTPQGEEQSTYVPTSGAKAVSVSQGNEPIFEVFTFKSMGLLPRLKWVIRGILLERTVSIISADSGGFKSFFALEAALCIATGTPFHGHEAQQGAVVYVAAEGFYTLLERATAWSQSRGLELPENFHILRVPVNIADPKIRAEFISTIENLIPSIVIFDTLSQNAQGLNENSNDEMALWLGGGIELGHQLGAHVCIIHHNSKGTGLYRGAGAIKANADTHITLERPDNDDENTVFVKCAKQRGKPFEPFALRGREIQIQGATDEYGEPITSLVFEPCGASITSTSKNPQTQRSDRTRVRLLEIFEMLESANPDGVKIGKWKNAVEESVPPICKDATFWIYRKKLEKEGDIEPCPHDEKMFRRVTPVGLVTPNQSNQREGTTGSENYSIYSNNPLGVGVDRVSSQSAANEPMPSARGRSASGSEPYKTPVRIPTNEGIFTNVEHDDSIFDDEE